ncbi:MAG: serine protease [Hyphomicrobiales bacterium]|nr:serine protease [Hyphomicrobiales bacterium]
MTGRSQKKKLSARALRLELYSLRHKLGERAEHDLGLRVPCTAYFQDPFVAEKHPDLAFDDNLNVRWEPGLSDGPTSARFAVVDFNGDTGELYSPAKWNEDKNQYTGPKGEMLGKGKKNSMQFHQVNVWAVVQRALDFFEDPRALGRTISWGFKGNRLIIVPHAGYGENAFYDKDSKSLQFYFFDTEEGRVFTCLSADIINHEFGHAVLDGVRPYFIESILTETAAFHEFVGDLSSILNALHNNKFRQHLVHATGGDLSQPSTLSAVAEEFGNAIKDFGPNETKVPYLRSALNKLTMQDVTGDTSHHSVSRVMTGAIFEILVALSKQYLKRQKREQKSVKSAFWNTIQRMRSVGIQPLDLLPPVDATFRDYAFALLRTEELTNPTDPHKYRELYIEVFEKRGIIGKDDATWLRKPHYLGTNFSMVSSDRWRPDVQHNITEIVKSPAAAYRFLDDNREDLFIPSNFDVYVLGTHRADKTTSTGQRPLPSQIIIQYMWQEDVLLKGKQFQQYEGQSTTLLCGGTLVFNDDGELLWWVRKPGAHFKTRVNSKAARSRAADELERGSARQAEFLQTVAQRLKAGHVGEFHASGAGLVGDHIPPFVASVDGESLRFRLSPHYGIDEDDDDLGGQQWEISS